MSIFDGSSAEMIVEDPAGGWSGGGPYPWNFDSFQVEDAEASENGTTYHGLAYFGHTEVIMYVVNEMAHPGDAPNSGDTWTDYHDACR
jgi:hypothetical protein